MTEELTTLTDPTLTEAESSMTIAEARQYWADAWIGPIENVVGFARVPRGGAKGTVGVVLTHIETRECFDDIPAGTERPLIVFRRESGRRGYICLDL